MRQPLLLFESRAIEDRFRKEMTNQHEKGGWLLCHSWGFTDYNKVNAMFGTFAMSVFAWILVPNESKMPRSEYWSSNFFAAQQIVEATCRSMGCVSLHFHTHPTGSSNDPSVQDGRFAIAHCSMGRNKGEAVVVQTSPLRVNYYRFEHNGKSKIYSYKGEYLSWRSPKMQQILAKD